MLYGMGKHTELPYKQQHAYKRYFKSGVIVFDHLSCWHILALLRSLIVAELKGCVLDL